MLLKNNSKNVKSLVRYFESLSIKNKFKLSIIVIKNEMIKLKIDKQKLIELLKNYLCIIDENYKKDTMLTLEFNMDIFILAKVMEMNKEEKERFGFEMIANIYKIIQD